MDQPATRVGSSCALQGCLIGSVVLFVILLLVMIFLAIGRFREETSPDAGEPTAEVHRRAPVASSVPLAIAREPRSLQTV